MIVWHSFLRLLWGDRNSSFHSLNDIEPSGFRFFEEFYEVIFLYFRSVLEPAEVSSKIYLLGNVPLFDMLTANYSNCKISSVFFDIKHGSIEIGARNMSVFVAFSNQTLDFHSKLTMRISLTYAVLAEIRFYFVFNDFLSNNHIGYAVSELDIVVLDLAWC